MINPYLVGGFSPTPQLEKYAKVKMGEDLPQFSRWTWEICEVSPPTYDLLLLPFHLSQVVPIDHRISGPDPRTLDLRLIWCDRHVTDKTWHLTAVTTPPGVKSLSSQQVVLVDLSSNLNHFSPGKKYVKIHGEQPNSTSRQTKPIKINDWKSSSTYSPINFPQKKKTHILHKLLVFKHIFAIQVI